MNIKLVINTYRILPVDFMKFDINLEVTAQINMNYYKNWEFMGIYHREK